MPEPRRPLSPSDDSSSESAPGEGPSRRPTIMSHRHSHRVSHDGVAAVRRPMSPSEASEFQPPSHESHAGPSKHTSTSSKRHSSLAAKDHRPSASGSHEGPSKRQSSLAHGPSTSGSHEGPSKTITSPDRSPTYKTYDTDRSPTYISSPGARLSRSPHRMDTAPPSAGSATTSTSVDQWRNNVPRLGFDVESDNDFGGDRTTVGSSSPTTNYSFGHNSAPSPVSSQAPSYRKCLLLYVIEFLFTDGKVYYRLYDEDGLLSCQHPLQDNDPSLGRISVIQITPPHSANHIKRALRKAEKIPESSTVALYIDISGEHELDDETRVSTSGNGPGSESSNALALVVTSEKVDTRREQHLLFFAVSAILIHVADKVSKLLKGILKRKSRSSSRQSCESSSQIPAATSQIPAATHLFDKRIKTIYKGDSPPFEYLFPRLIAYYILLQLTALMTIGSLTRGARSSTQMA